MQLLVVLALTFAPLPVAAGDSPSVPELIAKVKELRIKEAEARKAREAAEAELKAEAKRQQDELDKLFGPAPGPKPNPPEPVDPLRAKLRAAFDADPAQLDIRRNYAKLLAEMYRQGAGYATDPATVTAGDLLTLMGKAAAVLLEDPKPTVADPNPRKNLADVRKVVAAELGALLPTDEPLTDAQRKGVADLFGRLATILDSFGG